MAAIVRPARGVVGIRAIHLVPLVLMHTWWNRHSLRHSVRGGHGTWFGLRSTG